MLLRIAIIFSISFASFAQQALTLEEAIRIALNKNTSLLQQENNLRTYNSDVKAAWGNFLPSVDASGSFSWTKTDDDRGGTVFVQGAPIKLPATSQQSRTYSVNANANWVLFDGLSNFSTLSQSENSLKAAKLSLERLKQDIVFQTISRYYDVIYLKEFIEVREEDLKWNQKNLETITERNKLGAVTLADVYAQQVRVGNAEVELIRAKNSQENAKLNLLYYLGLNVLDDYAFEDSLGSEEMDLIDQNLSGGFAGMKELVEQGLSERPDYKSARFSLESAMDGITTAFSGHLPRLTNFYNYSLRANQISELTDTRNLTIGLTLSIPIFSGFNTENRVEFAEVLADNRQIQLTDLEREIKRNIQTAFLNLQAAEAALEASRRSIVAAEENRKIEAEKYNLGAGILLNVLIANSEYLTAQTNFLNSQFNYIIVHKELLYHLGVLDYKKYE